MSCNASELMRGPGEAVPIGLIRFQRKTKGKIKPKFCLWKKTGCLRVVFGEVLCSTKGKPSQCGCGRNEKSQFGKFSWNGFGASATAGVPLVRAGCVAASSKIRCLFALLPQCRNPCQKQELINCHGISRWVPPYYQFPGFHLQPLHFSDPITQISFYPTNCTTHTAHQYH